MKKQTTIKGYSKDAVLETVKAQIKKVGTQKQFAEKYKIDPTVLSSVLNHGRAIPASMLESLGLEERSVFVLTGDRVKEEAKNGGV